MNLRERFAGIGVNLRISGHRPALTPEQHIEVKEMHESGLCVAEIVRRTGFGDKGVRTALRRQGIPIRNRGLGIRLSADVRAEAVRLYRSGLGLGRVAAEIGHSVGSVQTALRLVGVPTRDGRLYHFSEDFFSVIDSEEKAWVLGLLGADGCVTKDGRKWLISVAAKDRDAVDSIRRVANLPMPIRVRTTRQGRRMACLSVTSRKMASDLSALGVVPRKSLILKPWEPPPHLATPYWRGFFDGDGGFPRTQRNRCGHRAGLCGTLAVVSAFAEFVAEQTGIRIRPKPHGKIFVVTYMRLRAVKAIAHLLYDRASVYLCRKQAIAQKVIAAKPGRGDWTWLTPELLYEMRMGCRSWREVGRRLGFPDGVGIHKILRRLGVAGP